MSEPIPQWSKIATPIRNPLDEIKIEIKKMRDYLVQSTQKSADSCTNLVRKIDNIETKINEIEKNTAGFYVELQKIGDKNAQLSEKISEHERNSQNLLLTVAVIFLLMSALAVWQKYELIRHENGRIVAEKKAPSVDQKIEKKSSQYVPILPEPTRKNDHKRPKK